MTEIVVVRHEFGESKEENDKRRAVAYATNYGPAQYAGQAGTQGQYGARPGQQAGQAVPQQVSSPSAPRANADYPPQGGAGQQASYPPSGFMSIPDGVGKDRLSIDPS